MLQQLARVAGRRGDLTKAESYLLRALELYKTVYGDASMHINFVSLYLQLGKTVAAAGRCAQQTKHSSVGTARG